MLIDPNRDHVLNVPDELLSEAVKILELLRSVGIAVERPFDTLVLGLETTSILLAFARALLEQAPFILSRAGRVHVRFIVPDLVEVVSRGEDIGSIVARAEYVYEWKKFDLPRRPTYAPFTFVLVFRPSNMLIAKVRDLVKKYCRERLGVELSSNVELPREHKLYASCSKGKLTFRLPEDVVRGLYEVLGGKARYVEEFVRSWLRNLLKPYVTDVLEVVHRVLLRAKTLFEELREQYRF